ncbi:hypothetical protein TNIN_108261 [Trichonephila inaurata madagascariensis]|uniref:Uncharacterized protein n=1 Tax=Trichonephila inaurata madagascariensis TaxID=2747483 RepID=A0A8X6WQ40_9ARAC|nr:hypothetical protein TNIN_108261 [Trichonephila inaurata madagascariensis]
METFLKTKSDMGDLNETDHHPDLRNVINELEDNIDDKEGIGNPLTMEGASLDHFNNPVPGFSNCQQHSSLLGGDEVENYMEKTQFAIQRRTYTFHRKYRPFPFTSRARDIISIFFRIYK